MGLRVRLDSPKKGNSIAQIGDTWFFHGQRHGSNYYEFKIDFSDQFANNDTSFEVHSLVLEADFFDCDDFVETIPKLSGIELTFFFF